MLLVMTSHHEVHKHILCYRPREGYVYCQG